MTLKHKLRSFAFSPAPPRSGSAGSVAVGLATNSVEVVDVGAEGGGYEVSSRLELQGHRSDVRCLALSADDTQVCGCGGGGGGGGSRRVPCACRAVRVRACVGGLRGKGEGRSRGRGLEWGGQPGTADSEGVGSDSHWCMYVFVSMDPFLCIISPCMVILSEDFTIPSSTACGCARAPVSDFTLPILAVPAAAAVVWEQCRLQTVESHHWCMPGQH
jgi:hypothetical protein